MIKIEFVKKEDVRNNDVADYYYEGEDLIIKVVDTGDEIYNRAVILHELIEEALTKKRGITEQMVTSFDRKCFEENMYETAYGDQPDCPYRKEHRFAENIERLFIQESGKDWFTYDKVIDSL